jgi:hypothetical protein
MFSQKWFNSKKILGVSKNTKDYTTLALTARCCHDTGIVWGRLKRFGRDG